MKFPIEKQFKLTENFIDKYRDVKPNFGFGGLGEFVFYRTYSRIKEDGKNESWLEAVRRVVEGIYSIQWQHIDDYGLGWNGNKAQRSAQEMFDSIFNFKMLPSGRAFWAMGTPIVMEKGLTESLFNCSFISTSDTSRIDEVFANIMDFLMLGVGVGLDTRGTGKIKVSPQSHIEHPYVIPDSREGWVESLRLLVASFFGGKKYSFDYSLIREAGQPIKTFGGTASGHVPLKNLHESVHKSLSENVGKYLEEKTIADIANNIGVCVVSGNVRRSAEVLLSETRSDEFLDLKDYNKNPDRASFGWASNNSVISSVGDDYSDMVKRIVEQSEPGFMWIDNFRKYGRMRETEATSKDHRISGGNPCFSYDSKILTIDGYKEIGSLAGKIIELIDADGNVQTGKVFLSGEKETVKLNLSNKQSIACTPNHIFMDVDGNEVEASKTKGVKIMPYLSYPNLDSKYILYGYIQGDGSLSRLKSDAHKGIEVHIGKKDQDIHNLLIGHEYTIPSGGRTVYLQGGVKEDLISLGFSSNVLPKRNFPKTYGKWRIDKKASFLQGCFSANGCINNRGRITYKTTSKTFARQMVDTLEKDFGIYSYITTNKKHKNKFSNGTYTIKESYDINIARHESKTTFYNRINFYHAYKIEELHHQIISNSPYVRSIKNGKVEKVYDFSLPKFHWGVVEGYVAHNCMEIGLEDGELCNLCELIPSNHEEISEFKKTIKYAYLFTKTITLLKTNWENTNRVLLRNRRIGLSMTGIAQFRETRGLNTLKEWQETGYDLTRAYDEIYSDWFAVPKSIKMTTVKPSGTLSLLAGVTPGVHYSQSNFYIRRVRLANTSPFIKVLKKAGYSISPASEDPNNTSVVEFPVRLAEEIRTIDDVSMWEQLRLAEFCQKNWSDNSVSVTVTFDKREEKDLLPALEYAQFGLKSVSFMPKIDGGAYEQMPYETISKKEYEKMAKKIGELDFSNMVGMESIGEKYCETDVCELKTEEDNIKKEFNFGN